MVLLSSFHSERVRGLKPAGETQPTDSNKPAVIPVGTYDVGDGYFNTETKQVYSYVPQISEFDFVV